MPKEKCVRLRWRQVDIYDPETRLCVAFREGRPWLMFRATPTQWKYRKQNRFIFVRPFQIVERLDEPGEGG